MARTDSNLLVPPCPHCHGWRTMGVDEESGNLIAVCPHSHETKAPTLDELRDMQAQLASMQAAFMRQLPPGDPGEVG